MSDTPRSVQEKRTRSPSARPSGRPRKLISVVNRRRAAVLREGDIVALYDVTGITLATVHITGDILSFVNDVGYSLTVALSDA